MENNDTNSPPSDSSTSPSANPPKNISIQSSSSELWENLIETAVKFLNNPNVRQTPLSQRKAFLTKKGLSESEIQEALLRTNSYNDEEHRQTQLQQQIVPYNNNYHLVPAPSPAGRPPILWRDYATAMMFISGTTYLVYKFMRGYVLPAWFNVPDPERERLRRLDENINDVQNGLKFLVDSVQQTLGVVQQQQETMNRLVNQMVEKDKRYDSQEASIRELKQEINTIKTLLLNRDQFPSLPPVVHHVSSAPRLPAWQLAATTGPPQPVLVNGGGKFESGGDQLRDDDQVSEDAASERYTSANGSENGEKMTPV